MSNKYGFDLYAMTEPKTQQDIIALLNEAMDELSTVCGMFEALHAQDKEAMPA